MAPALSACTSQYGDLYGDCQYTLIVTMYNNKFKQILLASLGFSKNHIKYKGLMWFV